ncbi:MAG: RagB/SusD family nutrient uptake outer membrane protein [Saprospiraceae bacterium]|nr:RagB/SusD family nutrient uptake outer membrane protein [Saprospiraceae bacterium]
MINKLKFLNLILVCVFIASCTDLSYQAVDSTVVSAGAGGNVGKATDLITTLYAQLGKIQDSQNDTWGLSEMTSDEQIGPTRGTDWSDNGQLRSLHTHTWNAGHPFLLPTWNNLNTAVYQANVALTASDITEAQKGEARFLRAFFMNYIVDYWGVAPFREPSEGVGVNPKVLNRAEALAFITADINAAITALPECTDIGRASKTAARALLAKVVINKAVWTAANPAGPYTFAAADMDQVISLADQVAGSCGLQISTNYWDNFIPDNAAKSKELIFTIPNKRGAGVSGSVRSRYFCTLHYNQNPSVWNGFATLGSFYDKFQPADQRIGAAIPGVTDVSGLRAGLVIGQQKDKNGVDLKDRGGKPLIFTKKVLLSGNTEVDGIRVIKYPPDYANLDNPENDYVLIRLADILLLKAEALLRKGNAAGALTIVNDIRVKRGATALASVDLAALLDERGREFYWEGMRRNDQIRFGTFTGAWEFKTASADGHQVLFPIPQGALDSNPNLKQNAGY